MSSIVQKFNSGLNKDAKRRSGVPLEEELTPSQLAKQLHDKLGKKLGAVIDLTFTCRYYDSKVWDLECEFNVSLMCLCMLSTRLYYMTTLV